MTDAKQAMELVEQLREGAGRVARHCMRQAEHGDPSLISIPRHERDIDAIMEQAASLISSLVEENERLRGLVEQLSDAQPLPSAFVWTGEGSEESLFDAELRHENGKKPFDYLKAWLSMLRPFAFATRDESWGEMEKLLSIVMRNYVRHLRNAAAARQALAHPAQPEGEGHDH